MNFKEFEKKARCYFCDRPFHTLFAQDHYDRPKSKKRKVIFKEKYLYCNCSASRKYFNQDGYFFYLPVSNHYSIFIDTNLQICNIAKTKQLQQIERPFFILNNSIISPSITYPGIYLEKYIFEDNEFPEFILTDRLTLIEKLKNLIVFS